MFYSETEVGITTNSMPLHELDALLHLLGETMLWRRVNGSNPRNVLIRRRHPSSYHDD
jgi:hypothetical protein